MADFSDIVTELKKTNKKLDRLGDAADPKGAAATEDKRDAAAAAARSENYLKTIANAVSGAGAGAGAGLDPKDKQRGGLLAGIGGALGGLGIGAGAAIGGLGVLFAGGGYLLKQIAEFDGKKVVENVEHLMSINDLFDGPWDALKEGGGFFIAMTAIGAGLLVFSAGAAVANVVLHFTRDTDWAQDVYDNVETLVSIQNITGYDTFDASGFAGTMGGISGGLIKFAVGEFVSGVSAKFTEGMAWTQAIYDNVEILISIQNIKGYDSFDSEKFSKTMGGISGGLVKFAIAEVMSGLAAKFTSGMAWTQAIYDNVEKLISIQNIEGYDTFNSEKFSSTMGGIAAGLVKFAIGEVMTGLAQKFTEGMAWTQAIYDNVKKLVSIQFILGYDTFKSEKFSSTMGGIALGLIAFAFGQAASGLATAITRFTDASTWAQDIYDNVKTLVSIQFIEGYSTFKAGNFAKTMAGIALGLIAFAFGSAAAKDDNSSKMDKSLTQFSKTGTWAQSIYDNVATLISIMTIPNIKEDTAKFVKVMTGLAAGLFAFAVGKGTNVMADTLSKFTGNFADNIKTDVTTLLSILNDDNINVQKSIDLNTILGNISAGLMKFGAQNFINSLASAASTVFNFLAGDNSPIKQVKLIADESENLTKGADAITAIGDGLNNIASLSFDGSNIKIKDFAEDLIQSVPLIEAAIMGGKIEGSILSALKFWEDSDDKEFLGLASPDIKWADAVANITALRTALDGASTGQGLNAQRTEQIRRGPVAYQPGRGPSIVNAPVTSINNSQSNMTHTTTSFGHSNPLLAAINAAN